MGLTSFNMVDQTGVSITSPAVWITPLGSKERNYTFLARKEFTVEGISARRVLRVTADSRYVLYLNDTLVGWGPARGTHKRYFFDSYDVTAALREGPNLIVAEVHCPVTPVTSAADPVAPALWLEIEDLVKTDASWQVAADPSHRSDALFYTHHIGYSEYRDMRKALASTDWEAAVELGPELLGRVLSPRAIPPLTNDKYLPVRVMDIGSVPAHLPDVEDDLEYAALMQMEMHLKHSVRRFERPEALMRGGNVVVLPGAHLTPNDRGEGAYIILDFGREIHGGLVLDVEGTDGVILDIGYDEDVCNGRIDPRRVNANGVPYRFADRYILREGRQKIADRLHDRGFRVVQLTFRRLHEPVILHSVEAENRVYPIPTRASFRCDQDFINSLWEMSCATLSACSTDVFLDCPWREQTQWLDDFQQESLFYLGLTADRTFPSHCFRVCVDGMMPNGMMSARYPSERGCLLPVTSANWTIALSDYYQYTGDTDLIRELLPAIDKMLGVYDEWMDADGLVPDQEGPGMWNFLEWGYSRAGVELGGKTAALNLLIAAALERAGDMRAAVGNTVGAENLARKSRELVAAINRTFWLAEDGRLFDCTEPKRGGRTFSQATHAVALYYDLLPDGQREQAVNALLHPDAIRAEYGFQLFVLDSLTRNGRAGEALQYIHDLWGHMVAAGSPTFWEVYDGRHSMAGSGSLCHGFSCYPMYFLQTVALGVRPLKPGFEEFTLDPHSLGLLHAAGDVPTPHGVIHVELEAGGARVDVPPGTQAVLADGRTLPPGSHTIGLTEMKRSEK